MKMLAGLLAVCCWAQTAHLDRTLQELGSVHHLTEVAISPDAARLAWVEDRGGERAIFVLDWQAPGAAPRRVAVGSSAAWSPDSGSLAFLAGGTPGQSQLQLWTVPATGGPARRRTDARGYLADPVWSPDSRQIALLFAEDAAGGGGPLSAVQAETGVIESVIHNQRLAVVDVASGSMRQVSPPDLHVYEYDWSPDGRAFAFTAAPGPGDNNWWIAQLYTMSIGSGRPRSIFRPGVRDQLAVPRWSPDGRSIAFIGGLMSDEGFTGGDLFTVPSDGGEAVNRTPGRPSSPSWLAWRSPDTLLFTETVGGGSAISNLELATGRTATLWKGDFDVHAGGNYPNFSLARDGSSSALIRRSWAEAPEVWAGPAGRWRPVTRLNAALKPRWGRGESLSWKNEGFDVQGWLLYPEPYDPARRYPMVVFVHGGPSNFRKPAWPEKFFDLSVLSGEGYFVFFPNPRGSYGQGEAFVQANVKDFGGGDLRDIIAGVDLIVKTRPVDPSRIGITGWSYGGFMSMWAVTQTGRFRAAVAGAGIANWQSYYGQNSIDRWMIPFFGASVYDDPAVYAKSSPINFIKNVKTPTLVLVGERDGECPPPQAYEFWHAMKTLGVPTRLVVYAGEGHDFRALENRSDAVRRAASWFDSLLK